MGEWRETKLGDTLLKITKGTTPSAKMGGFSETGINYIKSECVTYDGRIDVSKFVRISGEVHDNLKRSQLQENDILFSMAGVFLGKSALVRKEMLPANTNQALAIIRVDSQKALPEYIGLFLRQNNVIEFVNNMSGQSAQPNVNFEEIKSIPVRLPSDPEEQEAIAGVLSCFDDKIDLLHRQNKTLESLAETLFRQTFFEEAQNDWEERQVADIATHLKSNVKPQENKETLYNHYSLPAYDAAMQSVQEVGAEIRSNKYSVPKNSILVSKLNPRFPRIWPIGNDIAENAICSTEFQVFKPINPQLYGFLLYLFKSQEARKYLEMAASGTSGSHQRVSPKDILDISFKWNEDKASYFSNKVVPIITKSHKNRAQIQTLEKLRDTLLPKLMSGQVRVQYDGAA